MGKKDTDPVKYFEPTFHFLTRSIKIGEDYTTDKIAVSEFVTGGQLLADFPNFQRFAEKGYVKTPIELGENTTFSKDGESVLAAVPGYPKIKTLKNDDDSEPKIIISVEPLFAVSPDNMKVTLSIHPPLTDGQTLKDVDLSALLEEEGIVFGIDAIALDKAKEFIQSEVIEFKRFPIAKGQIVGKSRDAYLEFALEIGPIAGTLLEDGSIDFRDRRIMVGISAGDLIATKIAAVQGEPGIDIYGEQRQAKEGKDIKIQLLNDAHFSNETLEITAGRDGVLSVVNNNVIKVCSHQVINGDIDYETGNVDSMNAVTIRGSIQPGFQVKTEGDLEITGSIMSAKIACHGNLVVKGGITGSSSTIVCKGDTDINFIEQGSLKSGGIVVIRKQSYYSHISAAADIRCREMSIIMSGSLIAEGNITLGDVGSENAKPALIAAGVVAKRLEEYTTLKKSVVEQQDAIIQWLHRYHGSSRSKKVKRMEQELSDTKLALLRLNLIPGTGIYSRAGAEDINGSQDGADYNDSEGIDMTTVTIDIKGTIFAGTKIRIGNCAMVLDKTITNRRLKLHANQKRIIAGPIKRK